MGASCSGDKSGQVHNTINKVSLTAEAKDHLKTLTAGKDPLSKYTDFNLLMLQVKIKFKKL